ncbi:MAG: AraC family transcriptional regulator [Verrucomicrobiota bacterium]
MPVEFQDLLHEHLEIQVRGYRVLRVALHRHYSSVDEVASHQHPDHDQALVYLRGRGVQIVGSEEMPVRRGSLLFLSQGTTHGFRRERSQSPICLALDLVCPDRDTWTIHSVIPSEILGRIERHVLQLSELENGLAIASSVLDILTSVQEIAHDAQPRSGPWTTRVRHHIKSSDIREVSVTNVSEALGKNPEVLNRYVRRESQLTLGQMISARRLDLAQQLLRSTCLPIGEVGERIGILDQNYFARWFRQQTGQTPTHWRDSTEEKPS